MNWLVDPHGHGAAAVSTLGWFVFGVFTLTILAIWALLAWIMIAHRGRHTLGEHLPWYASGGKMWVVIGGVGVPGVVFLVILILGLSTMHAVPLEGHHAGPAEVRVDARQWWWELTYLGTTPDQQVKTANELHVPVGRPFVIEMTSHDVIHSFWVPELHGKMDVIPGQTTRLVLEARRPGVYYGQCAEFCGEQHAKMRIVVIAQTPENYEQWLAQQRLPAAQPVTAAAIRGQELVNTRACGLCHTVRGTRALGTVGPDLTHVASRTTIAGASLPNKHAYIAAWSMAAQSLKPENQMPNLNQLTGEELNAVAEYLKGLK